MINSSPANSGGIGGYFGLDVGDAPHGPVPMRFASARHALGSLLTSLSRSRDSNLTLSLPAILCPDVLTFLRRYHPDVAIEFYAINELLRPVSPSPADVLYLSNLFAIAPAVSAAGVVIADNAQAFFDPPLADSYTIYSVRKFLPVPDGAYLYGASAVDEPLTDWTAAVPEFMRMRSEGRLEEGLAAFRDQESRFSRNDDRSMSALSRAIVAASDLALVAETRRSNFLILHSHLRESNRLSEVIDFRIDSPDFVPYTYPFLSPGGGSLRQKLTRENIWTPTLWPLETFEVELTSWERELVLSTVHLPVDQRYGSADMGRVLAAVG